MHIVKSRDLVFKRGSRAYLNDVNFDLREGELMGLIGHNGAGKSTLIKLILGLLPISSGELTVMGGRPGTQLLKVGYLPENVSFYDAMTVREHLRYFADLKSVSRARVDELIQSLGLDVVIDHKLGLCSKGQRQRLGLAQALLSEPRLLLLDEPTVGLDPVASQHMYKELSHLRHQGCAIVVCTHELALVEPYLDSALLLANGAQRGYGTLDQLREQAGLPVTIIVKDVDVLRHPEVSPFVFEGRIVVPEGGLPDLVRLLTQTVGCYDFQVRKADLGAIFNHYVLNK